MPYQRLLDGLLRSISGAEAALLLDSQGEMVMQAGERDPRHRLIGAYQGIGLAAAQRLTARHGVGAIRYLFCRYAGGQVVLRPLKDGYYLVVALAHGANVGKGLHLSAEVQGRMNAEL
jgi:predicted regulator of Ras-like GTPase activity (Roadblock/LC7/MglB family)